MAETRPRRKKACFLGVYRGKRSRAQSTLESAILIVCLVAALLAMQVYLKRGMQGRLRQLADELGQQYAPGNTTGNSTLSYSSTSTTQASTLSERELTDRYGYDIDLDEDGIIEDDVFATETLSTLDSSSSQQKGEEQVGALEKTLF